MDDIYKNIEECNPNKKRKILIVFDDMIADIAINKKLSNKKLNRIVTELFIRGRKLNIALIMKFPNKQEFQQIPFNHASDVDFKDFMNFYKKCTSKPYSFLAIHVTLA